MTGTHRPAQADTSARRPITATRRLAALGASLGAMLVLAACSSSTKGNGIHPGSAASAPQNSASTSADSAGSSTPSAPVARSTVTATAPSAVSTGCTNAQISVTATNPPGGAAAGHDGVVLLFTNNSTSTCTLTGYPGVAGLDASEHQVAQAARTLEGYLAGCACNTPPELTLHAGAVVSAMVEAVDALNGGPCTSFAGLLVTPPNTTLSTKVSLAPYSCQFEIHPVVVGQTGSARPN